MSREVKYLEDKDIVVARTSGSYELEAEIDTLKDVIAKLSEHNCKRCIFDHRETTVIAKTMGSFNRPGLYNDLGLGRSVSMAIVLRELNDDLKFYENVCVNRGWKVHIFDDYDAALDWLAPQSAGI